MYRMFAFNPVGQERVSFAITQMKKYGSQGNIIWVGYGIKHIVTKLAESEEGLALVALYCTL